MHNVLIEMGSDVIFEELSLDVQYEISVLRTIWPAAVTPGTDAFAGKKIIHCVVRTDVEDIETYLNSLIIAYELDWRILHIQTVRAVEPVLVDDEIVGYQAAVIAQGNVADIEAYLEDREELDEDGNVIGLLSKSATWMHCYSGQAPWRI